MYKNRRISAVLLVRMRSTRLKAKMLLPFGDNTVIETAIDRIKKSNLIDSFILATSTNPVDDLFEAIAETNDMPCFRGSEDDVIDRMLKAANTIQPLPDILIRGCTDNPLLMPSILDEAIVLMADRGADMITPFEFNTFPFGYSLVAMTLKCLQKIDQLASETTYREHVENFCFEHPEDFRILYHKSPEDLNLPTLNLTLDYWRDYEELKEIHAWLEDVPLSQQPRELIRRIINRQSLSKDRAPSGVSTQFIPPREKTGSGIRKGFPTPSSATFPQVIHVEFFDNRHPEATASAMRITSTLLKKLQQELTMQTFDRVILGVHHDPRTHSEFETFHKELRSLIDEENTTIWPEGERFRSMPLVQSVFRQIFIYADGSISYSACHDERSAVMADCDDSSIAEAWQSQKFHRARVDILNNTSCPKF